MLAASMSCKDFQETLCPQLIQKWCLGFCSSLQSDKKQVVNDKNYVLWRGGIGTGDLLRQQLHNYITNPI